MKSGERKWRRMANEQLSKCWYKDICNDDCDSCTKYLVIKRQMEMSGVPESLHHPIILNCQDVDYKSFIRLDKIKTDIDEFVRSGSNLYICSSNTGNGKTSWALKMMYKLFSYVWESWGPLNPVALFIYVPEFIIKMKDFNNPLSKDYLEQIKKVPLVIWDDIGTGNLSDFDYTHLLIYINERQQAKLANIYTSNLVTVDELAGKVGDKLASRIFNPSEIIELKGTDVR